MVPAEQEIAQFVDALFRYAEEGTVIALRSFTHDPEDRMPRIQGWPVIRGDMAEVVRAATKAASEAANSATPLVFCPPVATFRPTRRAREIDLANGVAISVEVDSGNTAVAKAKLEHLLGPVTVAVASGGEWQDPETGELFTKLHLHWRLSEITKTEDDHRRLKQARDLAMVLVGADPSAVPLVHPLRWPGSWHRKGKPKLAMIAAGNPAAEVHLDDALSKLEDAVEAAGLAHAATDQTAARTPGTPEAAIGRLRSAVMVIPNEDLHWDEWVKTGLLIHRATGGSGDGLNLWIDWSMKASKYEAGACDERWAHFHGHPLTKAGAGTLFYRAKAHGWAPPEQASSPPPDHTQDEGYWASVEADDAAMTPAEWDVIHDREAGKTTPVSPQLKAHVGKELLWLIVDPWDEADIPKRPWIARGYLMRGAVTVVSGPGSAGKSSLMVGWAAALALGCSYGRFHLPGTMRVATYNVEDDEHEQKRRFSATLAQMGCKPESLKGNLAIIGPRDVGTLFHQPRDGRAMLNTPVMERLMNFIEEFDPDVLILDPFVELHTAEENDNTAIRAVMAAFRAIAAARNISIVILHHARKSMGGPSKPGDPDSLRGASSIVGAARVALTLNVMTEDEAKAFGIPENQRRDYFRLDGAKSNYAPIGDAEWFQRNERHLANSDGVAVAWPWTPPNLLRDAPMAEISEVLRAIDAGPKEGVLYAMTRRGRGNDRWVGNVIASKMGGTPEQAAEIVSKWKNTGMIYEEVYQDRDQRKPMQGVRVDFSKHFDTSNGGLQ